MFNVRKLCPAMGALMLIAGVAVTTVGGPASPVVAASSTTNFDGFTAGSPNGQFGWSSTGPYDHKIVDNTYGIASFGTKSLRVSNAETSGAFGDQTFSSSLTEQAGETTAAGGGFASGPMQPHFEASWDFASTVPSGEQPGLAVSASPDRGDGARMSWLQMTDTPAGLQINFNGYRDEHPTGGALGDVNGCSGSDNFFPTPIASGLDRAAVHTIKLTMDFLEGPRNDVVRVWVDENLVHTDTSWEDYFRYCEANQTRSVDSILFRSAGTAAPATSGNGFLIDNLSLRSGPTVIATSAGAWTLFPQQTSTTSTTTATMYQAKVRPPINADGTSNFPKRRGVIPVQFDLESATKTTTTATIGPVVFASIGSDTDTSNDYSFLKFVPTTPMLFADLNNLTAEYNFTTGNCAGGALRWSVKLDVNGDGFGDGNVNVYFGTAPAFTDCSGNSGQNVIGSSDARFDSTQLGGPFYGTYADSLALIGGATVLSTSLVLDGGWSQDQRVNLTGASADGNVWVPQTAGSTVTGVVTTPFAKTCALPAARIQWAKSDPTPDGAPNEAESIQPRDSGEFYRNVDCKYIYNLDVSSLDPNLATRGGTYRVWVNIAGTNVANPAKFDLL